MDNIKKVVAQNLVNLRKEEKLTQSALAKMLNYSDKAVSKWECGDSLPDLETLATLAKFYNVTLDLITENPEAREKKDVNKDDIMLIRNRIIISFIVVVAVFLVASLVFVFENMRETSFFSWKAFLWAIPISSIALLICTRKWKIENQIPMIVSSILLWSLLTCFYLPLLQMNLILYCNL